MCSDGNRRLLSPPRPGDSQGRRRHQSEMSNPEFALFIEKEHLKSAEENDYMLMENLIQRRYAKNVKMIMKIV